jgi:RNA polymerase sigma-70 factor (ECF subfamily)
MVDALRQAQLGNVAAAYQVPLLRFFQRRVGSTDEANDLVQDVFSRLAAQDLNAIDNIQGYIFKIAANVVRDRARRAGVRQIMTEAPDDVDLLDQTGFSPERLLQSREALQVLIKALYELPGPVRSVFSAYHFDGVAQVEISRRLGLSLSTVEKHMAKANAQLLRRLRDVL